MGVKAARFALDEKDGDRYLDREQQCYMVKKKENTNRNI
jgi:hypothetical protein